MINVECNSSVSRFDSPSVCGFTHRTCRLYGHSNAAVTARCRDLVSSWERLYSPWNGSWRFLLFNGIDAAQATVWAKAFSDCSASKSKGQRTFLNLDEPYQRRVSTS